MKPGEGVRLELVADGGAEWTSPEAPPADVRLRRLLKVIGRHFGFRVRSYEPINAGACAAGVDEREFILQKFAKHLDEADRDRLADQLFVVRWQGVVDIDADAAVSAVGRSERNGQGRGKVDDAAAWLNEYLGEYAHPSNDVVEAGREAGFSRDTLFRARQTPAASNIKASNFDLPCWYWGVGHRRDWKVKPKCG